MFSKGSIAACNSTTGETGGGGADERWEVTWIRLLQKAEVLKSGKQGVRLVKDTLGPRQKFHVHTNFKKENSYN